MAELEWSVLANYAEAPTQTGLLYIIGGGWDTATIGAPIENAPPGIVAAIVGHLVLRFGFHVTETDREHSASITIIDEDGGQAGSLEASFRVDRIRGLPPSWLQGVNIVIPLTGMALRKFGPYQIAISLNGNYVGSHQFRVLKGY